MKVSKNSWHYRLVVRFSTVRNIFSRNPQLPLWGDGFTMPNNLCSYFWLVVGTIFVKIPVVTVLSLLLLVLSPAIIPLGTLIFLSFCALCWTRDRVQDWLAARKQEPTGGGFWSLLVNYCKAAKAKICPFIEWED